MIVVFEYVPWQPPLLSLLLFQFIAKLFYKSSKDTYSMIGEGLAKFAERGENAKRGVKRPGAELFTNKGIHDLLYHLSNVLQPELFFRLYGPHEPLSVKYANMLQNVLVIFSTWF